LSGPHPLKVPVLETADSRAPSPGAGFRFSVKRKPKYDLKCLPAARLSLQDQRDLARSCLDMRRKSAFAMCANWRGPVRKCEAEGAHKDIPRVESGPVDRHDAGQWP